MWPDLPNSVEVDYIYNMRPPEQVVGLKVLGDKFFTRSIALLTHKNYILYNTWYIYDIENSSKFVKKCLKNQINIAKTQHPEIPSWTTPPKHRITPRFVVKWHPQKLMMAKMTSALSQSYDLHKIPLIKKNFSEWKYLTTSVPWVTISRICKKCGGPKTLYSLTMYKEYAVKTTHERNATSWK